MRTTMKDRLVAHVKENGPVKIARVATAFPAPVKNRYYGVSRGEVTVNKKGNLVVHITKSAKDARWIYRDPADAEAECFATCADESRVAISGRSIGKNEIKTLVNFLGL